MFVVLFFWRLFGVCVGVLLCRFAAMHIGTPGIAMLLVSSKSCPLNLIEMFIVSSSVSMKSMGSAVSSMLNSMFRFVVFVFMWIPGSPCC